MSPLLVFAAHIALYSVLPFAFAVIKGPSRLLLFYVYAGAVLTVGGFLGSVYSIPLNDTVNLSGGTLAYGALMMTALLMVIVERDVTVLASMVRLVITMELFKFLLFSVISWTLRIGPIENPYSTSADVFTTSARLILIGGALILAELLAMFAILERIKSRLNNLILLTVVCVALFDVTLVIDGLVFPFLALPLEPALISIVANAPSKVVMALGFSLPVMMFLVIFRGRLAAYQASPMRMRDLIFAPREVLVHEIARQQGLIAVGEEQYRSAVASAQAISDRGERLAELANDAIVSIDSASAITGWNGRAQELFGWTRPEAVGKSVTDLVIPERFHRAHRDAVARIVSDGKPIPITRHPTGLSGRRRDGVEVPIELSIAHELTDDGWVFTGFLRDQAGEAIARAELQEQMERRERVAASLTRIRSTGTPEEIARSLCAEIAHALAEVLVAVEEVIGRGPSAAIVPLALHATSVQPEMPIDVGRPLPQPRSQMLLARSRGGPWVLDLATEELTPYLQQWVDAGVRTAAYVPIGDAGDPKALLVVGSGRANVAHLAGLAPDLQEYAAIASAYLGQALIDRRAMGQIREATRSVIDRTAFRPVFQPIIDLERRVTIGTEALSRFDDGRRPDLVFAEATAAGLGQELELATLSEIFKAAERQPAGEFLSVNVSPELILSERLAAALPTWKERIVLEVTEHVEIHDYPAVRAAMATLGQVRLAVDDAGAGFASLRHILELEPDFLKLDMSLVRGIEDDSARQSLIAGMVYFAVRTGRSLIAEGIETDAELETLQSLGVELGQGYLLGRPGLLASD